jgi:hypothetical protein
MFGHRAPLDQRIHIKKKIVPNPPSFLETLPAPARPDSDQVRVECGFRGDWIKLHVPRTITEEEFNALASSTIGAPVATTDFTGAPLEDQQFRFFPDVSHGPPIWITLRQGLKRSNLTMIMRVSRESTQAEIERAASEYWQQPLEFKAFPKVFDATVIYWMHPHAEEPSADGLSFPEPDTLDAIPHVPAPTFKPLVYSFPRSLSSDDLRVPSKDPAA